MVKAIVLQGTAKEWSVWVIDEECGWDEVAR